ncbi:hypothetical protein [Sphingobacterium haloxyli]|uniref:hypothetical protein n=1 Tax=Sphingobacterium haloxyli TaxID=2100533 RepID=UPI001FAEE5F5|nr:hypothetical protein [Sphingobacterium haloxyli]
MTQIRRQPQHGTDAVLEVLTFFTQSHFSQEGKPCNSVYTFGVRSVSDAGHEVLCKLQAGRVDAE